MIHLTVLMALLAVTHIFCLAVMTERKYSLKKTLTVYTVFGVVFVGLAVGTVALFGDRTAQAGIAAFSSSVFVAFFVFILTSADPFWKKLFLFLSYVNLFCIFFSISAFLCGELFSGLSDTGASYAKNIVRTLLYIPAVLVYLKFLRPVVRSVPGIRKKTWISISLVSALFLLVFIPFMTASYVNYSNRATVSLFMTVMDLYCAVLWVVFGTIRHMNEESKMELVHKNVEYLQNQLTLVKENELAARTIRHDFRHHNQNLAVLLKQGNVEKALRYIEQYDESISDSKLQEFCPHTTVNAILNNFLEKAKKDGISVFMSADTPEESPVTDMDFVAILSNLLENALNGCRECGSHGEIQVNIRTVADKTVIVCSNPCIPDLAIENNLPKNRGTGIESIILAARKYSGDIRYELENGRLTVCIILNT